MKTEKRTIPCYCGNNVEIDVADIVDLRSEPDIEADVLSGKFLNVVCPSCGKLLKPEFPTRFVDRGRNLEILLVPELERSAFARGKTDYRVDDETAGRVVIGYAELVEKLRIADAGLDDRVVETIKYRLMQKAEDSGAVDIFFHGVEPDAMIFHIHGLKAAEVGVSRIPMKLYERVAADAAAAEEPLATMLRPPYVSIQKAVDDSDGDGSVE